MAGIFPSKPEPFVCTELSVSPLIHVIFPSPVPCPVPGTLMGGESHPSALRIAALALPRCALAAASRPPCSPATTSIRHRSEKYVEGPYASPPKTKALRGPGNTVPSLGILSSSQSPPDSKDKLYGLPPSPSSTPSLGPSHARFPANHPAASVDIECLYLRGGMACHGFTRVPLNSVCPCMIPIPIAALVSWSFEVR